MNAVYTRLKGGQYSDTDIQSLNDNVSSFGKVSGSNGVDIKDRAVPVPGAALGHCALHPDSPTKQA